MIGPPARAGSNKSDEGASGRAVPIERFRSDNRLIQLRQLPVRTVQTMFEDPGAFDNAVGSVPVFAPGTQLFEGKDFMVDVFELGVPGVTGSLPVCISGFVFRRTGVFSQVERSVQVTYTAGWTSAEIQLRYPQFKKAVRDTVVKFFNEYKFQRPNVLTGVGGGAVVAEAISGYSVSVDAESQRNNYGLITVLPPSVMRLLEEDLRYSKFI